MKVESIPPRRQLPPLLKLALEMGPLVVFFLGNAYAERFGVPAENKLFVATGVFIVATVIALSAHFALLRRLPIMPLVSGAVVLVFGGLTLALQDKTFIMMKPTIVNSLFGLVLLGGLLFNKSLLSVLLDSMFALTEEGWRKLTFRWGLFFLALAALNEVVWRTQTEDFWVNFKVFGIMPLTIVFALAQTPLLLRHERKDEAAARVN
ncbi:MAG TPA: septation protein A [Methylorubrum populi]|uniref:Inner membrane-spanning protein YciB n=1 Tax=Methylorubrum populi TaxID=223967 RepID=A0A921E5F6_9HYPH|nr:septation protein A [Methylorubrum populi]